MKQYLRHGLFLLIMAGMTSRTPAQTAEPPTLASLQNQYQTAQDQLTIEKARKTDKLKIDYSQALQKAGESAKTVGDLDLVLAIKDETQRLKNGTESTIEEQKKMPKPLADLRTKFETASLRITDEYAAQLAKLTARYIQNLELLEKKLTAGDNIDGAIAVRAEKERIGGKTAASENQEQDAWKKDWKNLANWGQASGGPADNWIAGDIKPGSRGNVPPYDASRTGMMEFHPVDVNTPALLRYEGVLSSLRPVLSVQAAGNVLGDCALICVVDGKKIGSAILDGQAWQTCNFDLTAYAGRKVTIDLQVASGGKDPWHYEHAFIDSIDFIKTNAPPAGPSNPPAMEPSKPQDNEVELLVFVDDGCEVYLNSERIEVTSGKVMKLRVSTGDVLAIKAWDVQGGVAGGLAVSLTQSNGKRLKTDTRWKCASREEPGWKEKTFDDKEWGRARIVDIGWISEGLKTNFKGKKPLIVWGKGGTVYFRQVIKPEAFD